MALKVGELYADIGLDESSFAKSLSGCEAKFNQAAGNMMKMGAGLTLGVTTPIVKGFQEIIAASTEWESAFAGVRKVLEMSNEEAAAMEQSIKNMATEIPKTTTEIASIMELGGALGVPKQDLDNFTKTVAALDEATDMTSESAATMFAQYANITGMDLAFFDELGSTVVDLGNNMAATESGIMEMAMRFAAAGSSVGMTNQEIMAISASLASVGLEAEAGGSAMSRLVQDMAVASSKGGKDLKNFAKVAGMSSKEFQAAFKENAAGALTDFIGGLKKVQTEGGDIYKVLDQMGINEIRMRDAIVRSVGAYDLLTGSFDLANSAWAENTALTDEAARRYETFASKVTMTKNAVNNAAIDLGDMLIPALSDVLDYAKSASIGFTSLDASTKLAGMKMAGLAAGLGPALIGMGAITKVIGNLRPLLMGMISPIGLVASGLLLFATAGVSANNDIGKTFEKLAKTVSSKTKTMSSAIAKFTDNASKNMPDLINSIRFSVTEVITSLGPAMTTGIASVVDTIANNMGGIVGIGTDIIKSLASNMKTGLPTLISSGANLMKSIVTGIIKAIPTIMTAAADIVTGLWNGLKSVNWMELGKEILSAIGSSIKQIVSLMLGWFSNAKSAIQRIDWAAVWTTIKSSFGSATEWLKGKFEEARDAVKGIDWSGIWSSIQTAFGDVKEWFLGKWRDAKDAIGTVDWSTVGSTIMGAITVAKDSFIEKAKEIITGIVGSLDSEEAKAAIGTITNVVTSIAAKIIANKSDLLTTAGGILGSLAEALIDANVLETAFTMGADIVKAIAGFIGSAAENIAPVAKDLAKGIGTALSKINWSEIFGSLASAGESVAGAAGTVVTAAAEIGASIINAIVDAIQSVPDLGKSLGAAAGSILMSLVDAITKATSSQSFDDLMIAIGNGMEAAVGLLGDIVGGIVTYLTTPDNLAKIFNAGVSLLVALGKGIGSALTGLSKGLFNVTSKLFRGLAGEIGKLFGLELSDVEPYVRQSLYTLTDSAGNVMKDSSGEAIKMWGIEMVSALQANQGTFAEQAAMVMGLMANGWDAGAYESKLNTVGVQLSNYVTNGMKDGVADANDIAAMAIMYVNGWDNGMASMYPDLYNSGVNMAEQIYSGAVTVEQLLQQLGIDSSMSVADALAGGYVVLAEDAEKSLGETKEAIEQFTSDMEALDPNVPPVEVTADTESAKIAAADMNSAVADSMTISTDLPAMAEEGVAGMTNAIYSKTPDLVAQLNTTGAEAVTALLSSLSYEDGLTLGARMIIGVKDGAAQEQSKSLLPSLRGISSAAMAAISSAMNFSAGSTIGRNVINGIISGVTGAASSLYASMRTIARQAINAAKTELGIHSPSKVAEEEIGKNVDLGAMKGIDRYAYLANESATRLAQGIAGSLKVTTATTSARSRQTAAQEKTTEAAISASNAATATAESLNAADIGTAIADRLNELEALKGDVFMDSDKVGELVARPVSKRIQEAFNRTLGARTAKAVLS